MDRLMTTEEVAEYLGKPASWLLNNADALGLPRIKLAKHYRDRLSDLEAWLDTHRVSRAAS
jgi:excisionase family DNA binding protein